LNSILLTDKIEKLSDTTKIKISDFGLSKIIEKIDSGNFTPMTGQLGTCVRTYILIFNNQALDGTRSNRK